MGGRNQGVGGDGEPELFVEVAPEAAGTEVPIVAAGGRHGIVGLALDAHTLIQIIVISNWIG